MTRAARWRSMILLCAATSLASMRARAEDAGAAARADAAVAATQTAAPSNPEDELLPVDRRPEVRLEVEPRTPVTLGQIVTATLRVTANDGDDVNVMTQSYAPFEIHKRNVRIEPVQNGKRTFVFTLELLPFALGEARIGPVRLRVLTADGTVGRVDSPTAVMQVRSLIGNTPDAQPKPPTRPVVVMEDDYTLAYLAAAGAIAALIAGLTLLVSRWWRRRKAERTPPPPPRPPWEIALEELTKLRRSARAFIEQGRTIELVDGVSDLLRVYLGARYGFEGLESTTDEVLARIKRVEHLRVPMPEIATLLRDCDLVKFAKMIPDEAQCVAFFDAAERIILATKPQPSIVPPPPGGSA